MADLANQAPSITGAFRSDVVTTAVTAAFTLNVDRFSHFYRKLGADSLAITWSGVRAGSPGEWVIALEQDATGTRLKPTNAASTNDAGTTLVFHTNGTGGSNAAWPTLSTTAGLIDLARWVTLDGVNIYLASFVLALDE